MKEMVYSNDKKREWLDHDEYKGYEYIIMSLGTHPTAYVGIPEAEAKVIFKEEDLEESDRINVHGGITYENSFIRDENGNKYSNGKWWVGWDYAHLYDYIVGNDYGQYRKKWTTEEILEEVKSVVNQIIEMGKKMNNIGMKYITVYRDDDDTIIAQFEKKDDGKIIGITSVGYKVIVDGEELLSMNDKEKENGID